ncbi:hypothetical protein F25303_6624 [Fusarium sp. NRRL 25303]|nr:hypothetical protein F25303_6624 [Fusarium sp. NRRL 25303]
MVLEGANLTAEAPDVLPLLFSAEFVVIFVVVTGHLAHLPISYLHLTLFLTNTLAKLVSQSLMVAGGSGGDVSGSVMAGSSEKNYSLPRLPPPAPQNFQSRPSSSASRPSTQTGNILPFLHQGHDIGGRGEPFGHIFDDNTPGRHGCCLGTGRFDLPNSASGGGNPVGAGEQGLAGGGLVGVRLVIVFSDAIRGEFISRPLGDNHTYTPSH